MGPCWERRRACSVGPRVGQTFPTKNSCSTASDAFSCQPLSAGAWETVHHRVIVWSGPTCQISPLWNVESHCQQTLSTSSCSFNVRPASSSGQRHCDEICHIRIAFPDHVERICPTGPGSGLNSSHCVSEAHPSQPARKAYEVGSVLVCTDVQQTVEHRPDGIVMCPCELLHTFWVDCAEEIVGPGDAAIRENQPSALEIRHSLDSVQQDFVFLGLDSQLGLHEFHVSEGCSQNGDPLLLWWQQ